MSLCKGVGRRYHGCAYCHSHADLLSVISFCALFSELRELVKLHGETHVETPDSDEEEEPLSYDEVLIIKVQLYNCVHSSSLMGLLFLFPSSRGLLMLIFYVITHIV